MSFWIPPAAVLSPCIGVCELGADGLCAGCLRSAAEIAVWSSLPDGERQRVMDEVLPQREAARGR
jgi:predicted Fe-S protein YdhL (DUF1289 family)